MLFKALNENSETISSIDGQIPKKEFIGLKKEVDKLKEAVDSLQTKIDLHIKSVPKENLIPNSPNLSNNLVEQFSSVLLQQSQNFREEMKEQSLNFREEMKEQFNLFLKSLALQSKDFEEKLISALKIQSEIKTENLKDKKISQTKKEINKINE